MSDNVRRCPRCGAKVSANDKYCRKCNAPLSSDRVEMLPRDPRKAASGMEGLPRPIRPTQPRRTAEDVAEETILAEELDEATAAPRGARPQQARPQQNRPQGQSRPPRAMSTARGPGYEPPPPPPKDNNKRLWGLVAILAVIVIIIAVAILLVIRLNRPASPETSQTFSPPAVETTPEGVPQPETTPEPTPTPTPAVTPTPVPTPTPTPSPTPQANETVYVTGNQVNIRSGPGTSYSSMGTVSAGTALQRLGRENGWSRVSYQGKEGYIVDTYITTTAPSSSPAPTGTPAPTNFTVTSASGTVTVTSASGANLRKGPGTNYDVVTGVGNNTQLERTGTSGQWTRVKYNGQELFIYNDLISDGSAQATATPAPSNYNVTEASGTVTVSSSTGANLRSGPGTNYGTVGSVANGTVLTRTGTSGDWTRVRYNNQDCFIATYLTTDGESGSATQVQSDSGTFTVTGNGVNVRSGPSTSYESLGTVNAGTTLTITGKSGQWYRVNYNGGSGYIIETYGTKS